MFKGEIIPTSDHARQRLGRRNGEETIEYEVITRPMEHANMPKMQQGEWRKRDVMFGIKMEGIPSNNIRG